MAINQCVFVGRLARDNETKTLPSNTVVLNNAIAVDDSYKDKNGNKVDRALFLDFALFGKGAEIFGQYTGKGDLVALTGKLELEQWNAQDGSKRSKHKLNVRDFQFLQTKNDKGGQQSATSQTQTAPPPPDDENIPF